MLAMVSAKKNYNRGRTDKKNGYTQNLLTTSVFGNRLLFVFLGFKLHFSNLTPCPLDCLCIYTHMHMGNYLVVIFSKG